MNKKFLMLLCGAFITSVYIFDTVAQSKSDSLIMRDILLEKDYSPQIENAGKVYQTPELEAIKTNKQAVQFAVSGNPLALDKDYVPLQAAEAKTEFPDQKRWGFVRLGFGNHLDLLGDAQVNIVRQERQRMGINLHSHSFLSLTQPYNRDFAYEDQHFGQINYQYHFNECELRASFVEDFRQWNYLLGGDYDGLQKNQWTSDSHLSLGIASKPWGKDFNYDIMIDGHLFCLGNERNNAHGPIERELTLTTGFSYRIDEVWTASLDLEFRNMGYNSAALKDIFWFDIQPMVSYRWRLWDLSLGLHLSDIIGKESSFKVAGIASASRNLGEHAAFRLSLDGGEKVYAYREGFTVNSYLNPKERLQASFSPVHLNARLQWNPVDMLQLRAEGGYQYLMNMVQFSAVDTSSKKELAFYEVSYLNTNILYTGAGLDFRWGKMLRMSGDFQYLHYGKDIWYTPGLLVDAALEFHPIGNLSLTADYHWSGLRHAPGKNGERLSLHDYHYYAASLTYQIGKVGVFAQCRSYLSPQYGLWNKEHHSGWTLAIIGASYTF